jgi:hypothetical protein
MNTPVFNALVIASMFLTGLATVLPADAQTSRRRSNRPVFDFLAPPSDETNRIYRVNIFSGEMGVCWYSKKGNVDLTECLSPGPGAGPQTRGLYTLVASNMKTERGVFRLNLVTGEVSMCWVKGDVLTCTPQAR